MEVYNLIIFYFCSAFKPSITALPFYGIQGFSSCYMLQSSFVSRYLLLRYGAGHQLIFREQSLRLLEVHVYRGWSFSDNGEKVLHLDRAMAFFLDHLCSLRKLPYLLLLMKIQSVLGFRDTATPPPQGFCISAEDRRCVPWSEEQNRPGTMAVMGDDGLPGPVTPGLIWLCGGTGTLAVLLPLDSLRLFHQLMAVKEAQEEEERE